jgi:hypothetical protein
METFDLFGLSDTPETAATAATTDSNDVEPRMELEQWAEDQLSRGTSDRPAFFDIETGPRDEAELRDIYHEKTADEFAADCDKRWKPDTVATKYEEYKVRAWREFVDRAALSPLTGRVLLIGMLQPLGHTSYFYEPTEAEFLGLFWEHVEAHLADKRPLIGHNSNSFDLPFLVRRSWYLGVPVPAAIRLGRYWHPLFRDTMEQWNCGARDFVKLNALGKFFGVGQKTEGVNGGDFHRLWFGQMPADQWGTPEQQRAKAIEYNGQDLRLTAAVAARMGMA